MDFKVKCVRVKKYPEYFNVGKIYEVKNNKVVSDTGWVGEMWADPSSGNADFEAFSKWFSPWYEFELVEEKKMFTKSDLKNGDVLVRRSGAVEIAIVDLGMMVTESGWNDLNEIKDDLTDEDYGFGEYNAPSEWDIVKVYRPTKKYMCQFNPDVYKLGELVYDYERETNPQPLYNARVVCIDLNGYKNAPFTVGKIYEVKDGEIITDSGYPLFSHELFHSFEEFSSHASAKFIEIKE